MKNTNEIMEKVLNQIHGKNIKVEQEGFIESSFNIDKAQFSIVEDIFSIEGESSFIRININQIYNVEMANNSIELSLDNDTKITLCIYRTAPKTKIPKLS